MAYYTIAGHRQIMGSYNFPCISSLWYCAFLCKQREENGLGYMEDKWQTHRIFPTVTVAPDNITTYLSPIECFALLLYDRTSILSSFVDKERGSESYEHQRWPYNPLQPKCISGAYCGVPPFNLHQGSLLPIREVGPMQDNGSLWGVQFERRIRVDNIR